MFGCSAPRRVDPKTCGNGVLDAFERCDDGNRDLRDGCDEACGVEEGWRCDGAPSRCETVCGDGRVRGREACDTAGASKGCTESCHVQIGYVCSGEGPEGCRAECGDGRVLAEETCNDANLEPGDGCSDTCAIEAGFACSANASSVCRAICGDGTVLGGETCDDGNLRDGDGCSSSCVLRAPRVPSRAEGSTILGRTHGAASRR